MEFSSLDQDVNRVVVVQCPTLDAADGPPNHAPCRARARATRPAADLDVKKMSSDNKMSIRSILAAMI